MTPTGLLTAKEAAAYLRLCEKSLYSLTKRGEIAAVKIGRSVRYRLSDLEQFVNGLVTTAAHNTTGE